MKYFNSPAITVMNSEFSHTAMTGLFVASSSNVMIERNVFTDIGYHGILQNGDQEMENITVANNYLDGSGITRHWSTNGIFSQGSRNVVISNNEVSRTVGGGIMVKSDSMGSDYWVDQAEDLSTLQRSCLSKYFNPKYFCISEVEC